MPGVHLLVSGRVQGVGFRWFVRVAARRLRLSGWVRNRPDGSVEIAADGSPDQLDQLRSDLWRGPDGAVVSEVADLETEVDGFDFPFAVRK